MAPKVKWSMVVALAGIVLTGLIVLATFEDHSSTASFYSDDLLPLSLMAAIPISIVGMIAWARHFGRVARFGAAVGFLIIGFLAELGAVNIHLPSTFAVLLVTLGSWIISLVLTLMAIFKRSNESS